MSQLCDEAWEQEFKDARQKIDMGKIENLVDSRLRHRTISDPFLYLQSWLRTARHFGYATRDESWGEMEKLFAIIISHQVLYEKITELVDKISNPSQGLYLLPRRLNDGTEVYRCVYCDQITDIDVPDDHVPEEHMDWHLETCPIRQIRVLIDRASI
jgi:hypothetical protein